MPPVFGGKRQPVFSPSTGTGQDLAFWRRVFQRRGGKTCLPLPMFYRIRDMATEPLRDSPETVELLNRARAGERDSLDDLFSRHRARLERMVSVRMAEALRGRIDASDVIQETYVEAWKRLPEYLSDPGVPFFLWLRFLAGQNLAALHRHHIGTQARDPRREVRLFGGAMPEASTVALAAHLLGRVSTPSVKVARIELQLKLQDALNLLAPAEREILALRHFEQLTNAEVAREVDITEAAASKRFIRALDRLHGILSHLGLENLIQ